MFNELFDAGCVPDMSYVVSMCRQFAYDWLHSTQTRKHMSDVRAQSEMICMLGHIKYIAVVL